MRQTHRVQRGPSSRWRIPYELLIPRLREAPVDVADATLALSSADLPPFVQERLRAIVGRADHGGHGVPVSVAARVLGVTEPTVRTWIARGALSAIPDSRPTAVTPRSLGEALAALATIRRIGQDERLLRRVLDLLHDQRERVELAGRIDELAERVRIDPDRVAEELFA